MTGKGKLYNNHWSVCTHARAHTHTHTHTHTIWGSMGSQKGYSFQLGDKLFNNQNM